MYEIFFVNFTIIIFVSGLRALNFKKTKPKNFL